MDAPSSVPRGGTAVRWPDDRLAAREARLDTVLPTLATKADVGQPRAEIQKGILETQRWMIATIVGLFIGFGGLFLAMSTALRPAPQAPVVISVPSGPHAPAPGAPAAPGGQRP